MSYINVGKVFEEVNNKIDKNTHEVIEFQVPNVENNYTWYRLYADGWVEQGGLTTVTATANSSAYILQISLPIEMADTNYTGWCSASFQGGSAWNGPYIDPTTTTTTIVHFNGWCTGSTTVTAHAWEVKGMAA